MLCFGDNRFNFTPITSPISMVINDFSSVIGVYVCMCVCEGGGEGKLNIFLFGDEERWQKDMVNLLKD